MIRPLCSGHRTIYVVVAVIGTGCGHNTACDSSVPKTFGQRQMEQMLQDRPGMKDVIPPSHPIFEWVVAGFNGDRLGQRVYWIAVSPRTGRPAEHYAPYEGYPPCIAISGGTESTAVDKWAGVVYEMYNLENSGRFDAILQSALNGSLYADDYAEKCVELEFAALSKTRDLFRNDPLPRSPHGRDVWYNWVTSDFGTFKAYKDANNGPGSSSFSSNFAYYKEYYETSIASFAESARRQAEDEK